MARLMNMHLKVSARLSGVVGAALLALCIIGTIAVVASREVRDLGHDLYEHNDQFSNFLRDLSIGLERAISDVHSAPSELDLKQLQAKQQHFNTLLGDIRTNVEAIVTGSAAADVKSGGSRIVGLLSTFEDASKKVFALTAAFAQPDAMAALSGAVTPAEAALRTALGELHHAADTSDAIEVASIDATTMRITWTVVGLSIFLVVAISLLAYAAVSRGVVRPIIALDGVMMRLSTGDSGVVVPHATRRDEIGDMARAVQVFKDNAIKMEAMRRQEEDDRRQADEEKQTALVGMAEKIETETGAALRQVSQNTAAMAANARSMSESAGRTGDSARSAAAAAAQALANAQTVASAAEELAASIREIGGQVSQSSTIVVRAVEVGRTTRQKMEMLNEQVGRIGVVADMIGEIAAKTNLLALNATIEAARAGDAGKGFAVVASEVKQLATQTARSTQEIARHIGEVRAATDASVASVGQIESTIGEINAIASSIAAAVEEQAAATAEIARNVTETAAAANSMTERTNEVSSEAERTGGQAAAVLENTTGLDAAVHQLQRVVIRVVRTSTREVDRRLLRRRPCLVEATIRHNGQTVTAPIHDISEHGCLAEVTEDWAVGQPIGIDMGEFGGRMQGTIMGRLEGGLHVAFTGGELSKGEADRISLATIPHLVRLAKGQHVAFVERVLNAVAGRESLAARDLATHTNCRLGRWYESVSDPVTLALPSFKGIADPHQAVHDRGRQALAAAGAGDMPAAQRFIAEMRQQSEHVMQCLDDFGREYPGTIEASRQETSTAA